MKNLISQGEQAVWNDLDSMASTPAVKGKKKQGEFRTIEQSDVDASTYRRGKDHWTRADYIRNKSLPYFGKKECDALGTEFDNLPNKTLIDGELRIERSFIQSFNDQTREKRLTARSDNAGSFSMRSTHIATELAPSAAESFTPGMNNAFKETFGEAFAVADPFTGAKKEVEGQKKTEDEVEAEALSTGRKLEAQLKTTTESVVSALRTGAASLVALKLADAADTEVGWGNAFEDEVTMMTRRTRLLAANYTAEALKGKVDGLEPFPEQVEAAVHTMLVTNFKQPTAKPEVLKEAVSTILTDAAAFPAGRARAAWDETGLQMLC